METIGKKAIPGFPPLMNNKVDIDRVCGNCACLNDKRDWCLLHKHSTSPINYGCKTWLTQEQLDAKLKAQQAKLEAESGIRVNYMLTLMFAFVSASYQIMTRSEAIVGELIGGKQWRFERKKALKDIMSSIGKIQTLYSTYFEKDYIQMMSDYGRSEFDTEKYDGFQMYSGDILMLCLTVMEHCYHDNAQLHEIIEEIRQRPNDLNLFSPEFVEQFRIKHNE
jgi:hypothetical protein